MLKPIIFSLCLILGIDSLVEAQIQAGKVLFGGTTGWNKSDDMGDPTKKDVKISKVTVQPIAGFSLKDNLAIGMFINYEHTREIHTSPLEKLTSISSLITAGPFVRKFFPLNNRFAFYGQGMLGYSLNKNVNEYGIPQHYDQSKKRGWTLALKPGFTFFATSKIGIDLSVQGIQYTTLKSENHEETNNSFNANFNLPSLNLGCNLYLGR